MDKEKTEYAVISNAVNILSVVCSGNREKIIDLLTGYLWDEEEAGGIKKSTGKFEIEFSTTQTNDNKNLTERFERKLIEVCGVCHKASCWHGEFLCLDAKQAGTVVKPVSELRKLSLEHESNWSDENINKIYGEPAPNGYKAER